MSEEIILPWKGNFNQPKEVPELIVYSRKVIANQEFLKQQFGFSSREMEIIIPLVDGKSNKQIGQYASITDKTVKWHMTNIMDKLGVTNRVQAVVLIVEALEGLF